jgi:hypothetical protein
MLESVTAQVLAAPDMAAWLLGYKTQQRDLFSPSVLYISWDIYRYFVRLISNTMAVLKIGDGLMGSQFVAVLRPR